MLEGVNVIEWNWNTSEGSRSRNGKRLVKNSVGNANLETPMLDKTLRNGRVEFCDVIICTRTVAKWENVIMNHFDSKDSRREEIDDGMKMTFMNTGDPILTASFYTKR